MARSLPSLALSARCRVPFVVALTLFLALAVTRPAAAAILVVDRTDDTNDPSAQACTVAANDCSLRGAVTAANALAGADTLSFDPVVFPVPGPTTLTLTLGQIVINESLTIEGPGSESLIVDGNSNPTFGGNGGNGTKSFTFNDLTITNAVNAINVAGSGDDSLFLNRVVVRGNVDPNNGGSVVVASFTAITITDCAFVDNDNDLALDISSSNATVTNSTFSNNTRKAIHIYPGNGVSAGTTTVSLTNVTLADNGTGVHVGTTPSGTTLDIDYQNSLFAANTNGNFQVGGTTSGTLHFNSLGNNLLDDSTGDPTPPPSDLLDTDPVLAALEILDGARVRPLLPGSPAIDAGEDSAAPAADQRGIARPQLGSSDIGAYESRGFQLSVDGGDGQATGVGTDFPSPLSVILLSSFFEPVEGGRITFTPPGSGASCSIAGNPATISATSATTGVVTANAIAGASYSVEATATGITAAASFLLTNLEQADLAVSNGDSPDPVVAGQNLTYTIDFVNNGPDDADDVVVADAVPANTTFVSAEVTTGSGWSIQAPTAGGTGAVEFSKGVVASAESAVFTLVVHVDPATPHATMIDSTVSASSTTNDSITGNDSATASTAVVQPAIFSDGFESGDTSQWTLTQPPTSEVLASVAVIPGASRVTFDYDFSTICAGRSLSPSPIALVTDGGGGELFRIVARRRGAAEPLELALAVPGSGASRSIPVAGSVQQVRLEWSLADASNFGHVALYLEGRLVLWVDGFSPTAPPVRARLFRGPTE